MLVSNSLFAQPVHKIDPELKPYLDLFVDIAKLKGINLNYIYEENIIIKFVRSVGGDRVAAAFRRDQSGITIFVNRDRFNQRTDEGRRYVMFHEFGHDILDLPHLQSPERGMMEPTAYTGFFRNYDRFTKEIQTSYLYKSLNKMFNRFKNK